MIDFILGMVSGVVLSISSGFLLGCIVRAFLNVRDKQIEDDKKGGL